MSKRNFHVPLPEELYQLLHSEAARLEMPATRVAREAIQQFLQRGRQELLHQQISEYARCCAGTEHDLDPLLEGAGSEFLWGTLEDDSW